MHRVIPTWLNNSMPHLKITTNITKNCVPVDFLNETSALVSKMLDKPENVSS